MSGTTLSISRYIDITSGVGGATIVPVRELIGRFITDNLLVPSGSVIEFSNAKQVGNYFGTSSVEYLRAVKYFSFISKNITQPSKISYARWVDANEPPMIFGGKLTLTLTQLKLITAGSFNLTLGGVTNTIGPLDFSGASTLAAIAAIIQAAIVAETGTQWSGASVTYDVSRGGFDLVGGAAVAANVIVGPPTSGTDISASIAWLETNGAIWSDGSLLETITDTLTNSTSVSNNFGSFLFIPALDQSQIVEAATWNDAQNNQFQFSQGVTASNASAISAAVIDLSGTVLTLSPITTEYPDQLNMAILAATDYASVNATTNYMYQSIGGLTPSVTTDLLADTYDALRVNYYGVTQEAGQLIAFYQTGVITGDPTVNPTDINTYANEQWVRATAEAVLLNLFLAESKISANISGINAVLAVLKATVISQGLSNGTISVGKNLSPTQIAFIKAISGDTDAPFQVQSQGYWLGCVIVPVTVNGLPQFQLSYTLIYSKDDAVRKIIGRDILI